MMSRVSNTENLRQLIKECAETKGLSYQAISDAAERKGFKLGKSVVGVLATQEHRSTPVTYNQIKGLAAGLGVQPSIVAGAVAADMGVVEIEQTAGVRLLLGSIQGLDDDDLRVLRQMAERLGASSDAGHTSPD